MNKLDQDYQELLLDILNNGVEKQDRTGTGTLSVFGRQIRHNMQDGFPLLTTKKMAWKQKEFMEFNKKFKATFPNQSNTGIWSVEDAFKNW